MALYTHYLVCYDIENNKTRRRFYDQLKDLGLLPLQKSVFWGELNQAEYRALQRLAHSMLDSATDRCFWIQTQLTVAQLRQAVGYASLEVINADGHYCL